MKVLVLLRELETLDELLSHLAERFSRSASIQLVAVAPAADLDGLPPSHVAVIDASLALTKRAKSVLKSTHGFADVMTAVERGSLTDSVLNAAERLEPSVVIFQGSKRRGLLCAFGRDRVLQRLCSDIQAPVEVFRPRGMSSEPAAPDQAKSVGRVVIPVNPDQLNALSPELIASLLNGSSATIELVGVVPREVNLGILEANPAAILRGLQNMPEPHTKFERAVQRTAEMLKQLLSAATDIAGVVVEGEYQHVVAKLAQDPSVSLMVLPAVAASNRNPQHEAKNPSREARKSH